jgi:rubrerythrin
MTDPTTERSEQQPVAMERLARDPSSRKRFLAMVGGAGAASAFGIFLAACGDDDKDTTATQPEVQPTTSGTRQFGMGDLGILNYALTLEYLESDFYRDAAASGVLKGSVLEVAKTFGEHEQAHVEALEATVKKLGGTPAKKPRTKFPLEDQASILDLAATVENLGAAAYLGQAANIKSKEVLAAALSIHTVEARHAAALNSAINKNVSPDGSFAQPATADEVLKQVKPFIVA